MIKDKTLAVIGGDLRNAYLANLLAEKHANFKVYGLLLDDNIKISNKVIKNNNTELVLPQSDIVIFPLPMADSCGFINTPFSHLNLSVEECLDYISRDAIILGGKISDKLYINMKNRGINISDYLNREEFAVMNAIPTAEGAVELALKELPITLFGSTCLITGFGRISKLLLKLLLSFGANVIVAARNQGDLAWVSSYGGKAVHLSDIDTYLKDADVLINTVPAYILGEEKLKRLNRECLIIDLASKPGGVDFEVAKALELKTIWALSLPGKVAPITAGKIIYKTVRNILAEEGIL